MIENRFAKTLNERKMDKRDVVKITGLDNHTIDNLYRAKTTRVDLNTLNKICFALECDTNDIFKYIPD